MTTQPVLSVENLSKAYAVYGKPSDRLKQIFSFRRRVYYSQFWALRDVNFEVYRGETIGIVGRNGSGKSTLLQIISGVLRPTTGFVKVYGQVAALLELGAGFNPEFTGRENIYLSGSVLGLSPEQIGEREEAIIEFSGIQDFINQPVKTYSSGMYARLAFSVASAVEPTILIVDEILAVGDAKFQARCFNRLQELKERGTTILLVTHSPEQVVTHCDKAILLERGSLLTIGKAKDVVNEYLKLLFPSSAESAESSHETLEPIWAPVPAHSFHIREQYNPYESRWGDKKAEIIDFQLLSAEGKPCPSFTTGTSATLFLTIQFHETVHDPIVGLTVKTREGVTINGSNTEMSEVQLGTVQAGIFHCFRITFIIPLGPGDYFLSVGVASRDKATGDVVPHDRRYDSIHLLVCNEVPFYGLCDLKMSFSLDSATETKEKHVA
jgi:lipopolysaccharide transport system ATP-binding protein